MSGQRPYFQKKITELKSLFESSRGDRAVLETLTDELKYRNVPKAKVAVCPNVGWIRDFADGQTMLSPTFAGKNILPQGNSNWPELDDPTINAAIDKAEIAPVEQRAQLWGDIDKQVTATAAAIPWIWDKQALVQSKNVEGVIAQNNSQWDLAWTSLK